MCMFVLRAMRAELTKLSRVKWPTDILNDRDICPMELAASGGGGSDLPPTNAGESSARSRSSISNGRKGRKTERQCVAEGLGP